MELQVGAVRLQATCDDVSVYKACVVSNDHVRKRCDHRWPPLSSGKVTLLVGLRDPPRLLHRSWCRGELNGARTFEDNEGAAPIIRLRSLIEKRVCVERHRPPTAVRATLIDDVYRVTTLVGGAGSSHKQV